MAPMVHGLEAEYFGKVKFSYLDADDPNTDTFQRTLGFYYQPEFYLAGCQWKRVEEIYRLYFARGFSGRICEVHSVVLFVQQTLKQA